MKTNQNRKYPASLFLMGFIMNLIKNFFLLFPGLVLLVAGIWVKWCLMVGVALLLADVIVSLIEQIQIRHTTIHSDNPNFKVWQDAVLSPEWQNNIINLSDSKAYDSDKEDCEILDSNAKTHEDEDNDT